MTIDLPESVSDQEITVKLKTLGLWEWHSFTPPLPDSIDYEDKLTVTTYLTIGVGAPENDNEFIDLVSYVKRIINSINIKDDSDTKIMYTLDSTTEAQLNKLSSEPCPEFTFETSTVWDKLEKVANYVNAVPEISDDFSTIKFRFLDEISDMYYDQDMFEEESINYAMDNYISGLETNASNLVEPDVLLNAKIYPYEGG